MFFSLSFLERQNIVSGDKPSLKRVTKNKERYLCLNNLRLLLIALFIWMPRNGFRTEVFIFPFFWLDLWTEILYIFHIWHTNFWYRFGRTSLAVISAISNNGCVFIFMIQRFWTLSLTRFIKAQNPSFYTFNLRSNIFCTSSVLRDATIESFRCWYDFFSTATCSSRTKFWCTFVTTNCA